MIFKELITAGCNSIQVPFDSYGCTKHFSFFSVPVAISLGILFTHSGVQ